MNLQPCSINNATVALHVTRSLERHVNRPVYGLKSRASSFQAESFKCVIVLFRIQMNLTILVTIAGLRSARYKCKVLKILYGKILSLRSPRYLSIKKLEFVFHFNAQYNFVIRQIRISSISNDYVHLTEMATEFIYSNKEISPFFLIFSSKLEKESMKRFVRARSAHVGTIPKDFLGRFQALHSCLAHLYRPVNKIISKTNHLNASP